MKHPSMRRTVSSLTPEQREQLAQRYPHESTTTLAEAYGLTVKQVYRMAERHKLHKAPGYQQIRAPYVLTRLQPSLASCVLNATQAAGSAGIDTDSLIAAVKQARPCSTSQQIRATRAFLSSSGRLHRASHHYRWFGTAAWAHAYQPATASDQRAATHADRMDRIRLREAAEAEARSEHIAATAHIDTSSMPKQVGRPFPMSRWDGLQVTDAAFSSRRPGQYLDDTPPAWVQAATAPRASA